VRNAGRHRSLVSGEPKSARRCDLSDHANARLAPAADVDATPSKEPSVASSPGSASRRRSRSTNNPSRSPTDGKTRSGSTIPRSQDDAEVVERSSKGSRRDYQATSTSSVAAFAVMRPTTRPRRRVRSPGFRPESRSASHRPRGTASDFKGSAVPRLAAFGGRGPPRASRRPMRRSSAVPRSREGGQLGGRERRRRCRPRGGEADEGSGSIG
jgi:hypothetical protein